MSCREDHTAQILLEVDNRDRGNNSEVEGRPRVATVGRSENANVGGGQHGVRSGVVAIDQQSQHGNVG